MRQVRTGEIVAGASAALLLVVDVPRLVRRSTSPSARCTGWTSDANAWQAFGVIDIVLALVVVLGLATLVSQLSAAARRCRSRSRSSPRRSR